MAVELSPKMQEFTQEVYPAIIGTNRKAGQLASHGPQAGAVEADAPKRIRKKG